MRPLSLLSVLLFLILSSALLPASSWAQAIDAYGYDAAGQYHTDGYGNSPNLNLNTTVDCSDLKAKLEQDFAALDRRPSDDSGDKPFQSGSWSDYYDTYTPPDVPVVPPPSPSTPQEQLIASATAGDSESAWTLANDYRYGEGGFDRDGSQAIVWLEKAALANHKGAALALYELYKPHESSSDPKKDVSGADSDKGRQVISGANGEDVNPCASNIATAVYWLKKSAESGDLVAMIELGNRYLQGAGVDADSAEGLRWLKSALEKGGTAALEPLFFAYKNGWGVEKDHKKALEYARQDRPYTLIDSSSAVSMAQLFIEDNDPKTNSNLDDIKMLFERFGDRTFSMAWLQANVADTGVLGRRDPAQAIEFYKTVASSSDPANLYQPQAQGMLADHYYTGDGIKRDLSEAWFWYQKAFAAAPEKQTADTSLNYATLLSQIRQRQEDGSWKDISDPARAYQIAVAAYDVVPASTSQIKARAAELCAVIGYRHPDAISKTPGRDAAAMAHLAALEDAKSYTLSARGLHDGWWGQADPTKALAEAAAGDSQGVPACTLLLAQWKAEASNGKDPDWKPLMHKAVMGGAPGATVWMASLLGAGKWLPKNPRLALKLLREAAPKDCAAANSLGIVLWRGDWGQKNVPEGLVWLQKALDGGSYPAGRNLAKIYHLGLGTEKNEDKAKAALEKCGEVGGRAGVRLVIDAYTKGDIINADPAAAARWSSGNPSVP